MCNPGERERDSVCVCEREKEHPSLLVVAVLDYAGNNLGIKETRECESARGLSWREREFVCVCVSEKEHQRRLSSSEGRPGLRQEQLWHVQHFYQGNQGV